MMKMMMIDDIMIIIMMMMTVMVLDNNNDDLDYDVFCISKKIKFRATNAPAMSRMHQHSKTKIVNPLCEKLKGLNDYLYSMY